MSYLKRTWAEVDVDALEHNFRVIRETADPQAGIMCVIKADAYGHGAVYLAKLYERLGAAWFAVSNIEEALQLRENHIRLPILILGFTPAYLAEELAEHRISQAVFSEEYARELSEYAVRCGKKVQIHIKLDTGMSRIGFMYQQIGRDDASLEEIRRVCALPGLEAEGVFTHFALSDEGEDGAAPTQHQFSCFQHAVEECRKAGCGFRIVHCSNSGALLDHREAHLDCVRAGIVLYGLLPSDKTLAKPNLLPAMRIKSVVAQVKTVGPDTPVSYGGTFVTKQPTAVATVPIGYADGYSRSLSNRAFMTVRGKRAPVIGRVCMDQVMLDVSGIEGVASGDEVVVIGNGRDGALSFDEIARLMGTINYEAVCLVGKRVPRVYLRNGKEICASGVMLHSSFPSGSFS